MDERVARSDFLSEEGLINDSPSLGMKLNWQV
jgi:hypothetical protein